MKKLFLLTLLAGLMWSCGLIGGSDSGELDRGNKGRKVRYSEAPPNGMSYVPAGNFLLGHNDQDLNMAINAGNKMVTVDAFWMDQTEITNYEYRQFVTYVKDSTIRRHLSENGFPEFLLEEEDQFDQDALPPINWRRRLNVKKDDGLRDALRELDYTPEESLFGRREFDVRRLVYEYSWFDMDQAAKARYDHKEKKYIGTVVNAQGEREEIKGRSSFIMRDRTEVYPDTLCWIRDFDYSYNEPFAARYFSHPAYNNYPVVGVSWKQAYAFCHWRTKKIEGGRRTYMGFEYRLPTESEWEYAARGGLQGSLYPWGGPYTTNKQGCYLANFKPQRGKYSLDGGVRTMPVASYDPNDYGLYDMAGNVAEWTNTAYDENAYNFYHDLMPNYTYNAKDSDPIIKKRKVVRGGSWKDAAYYLQSGTRTYEYQDSTHSYTGFRCARTYMGTAR
ncbi:MAG: SUMF1/EgtB/PvdO family nonheme iron enzyme [Bacteroidales bacterium]|nr:SUMF1/EgtB/PvdO family nonheme iron enzyme [Bacteroidales bacterium]MCL2132933.1 SUMF1/EgtB/PvdO family nonheme iron enzyme [Bacteroidales bacterium]